MEKGEKEMITTTAFTIFGVVFAKWSSKKRKEAKDERASN